MSNAVSLALKHHRELNESGHYWAAFEFIRHSDYHKTIRLDIGLFNSHGEKERCIATRYYYQDKDGKTHWHESVHP